MGKRNLNLELFVVVSWMNSWVSPFIIPDIICFGFFTLDPRMVKFFMKLGVKFHSFFLEKKGEIFVPFTLFEKWKWNENDWKSRSRSESEIKMTGDRDREVKFQKNSRESRLSQGTVTPFLPITSLATPKVCHLKEILKIMEQRCFFHTARAQWSPTHRWLLFHCIVLFM